MSPADPGRPATTRVVTWNTRRAAAKSPAWDYLRGLAPDVALLQEVTGYPAWVDGEYAAWFEPATRRSGAPQSFGNLVLSRGGILGQLRLVSGLDWVNRERAFFGGNISAVVASTPLGPLHLVNLYSPAWPLARGRLAGIDVAGVKLALNPDTWCTEIAWKLLVDTPGIRDLPLVVGGDFNSSETFDYLWRGGPRGNREVMDRMNALGLRDVLRETRGVLVPTHRSNRNDTVVHQLDHLYVDGDLLARVTGCDVGSREAVFGANLSDHLPVVADFAAWEGPGAGGIEPGLT